MKELFVCALVFLLIIIIVFFSGQQFWSPYHSSEKQHAELAGSPKCVTYERRVDGFGSHAYYYFALKAYEKDTGIKGCFPSSKDIEHLQDQDTDKVRNMIGMSAQESDNCSECTVLKDTGFSESSQSNDIGKSRFFRNRTFLQSLYKPPLDLPRLLDQRKFNLVVHYRVMTKADLDDEKFNFVVRNGVRSKRDKNEQDVLAKYYARRQQDTKEIDSQIIESFIDILKKDGVKDQILVHIMSQKGTLKEEEQTKKEFQEKGWLVYDNASIIDTFDAMVRCDALLVCAHSQLSRVAGILNKSKYVFQSRIIEGSFTNENWFPTIKK